MFSSQPAGSCARQLTLQQLFEYIPAVHFSMSNPSELVVTRAVSEVSRPRPTIVTILTDLGLQSLVGAPIYTLKLLSVLHLRNVPGRFLPSWGV